jgi:quinol monooxygenase YgiN
MVTLLTTFHPKDAQSTHEISGRLAALAKQVPAEPGNLDYNAFAVEGEPHLLYVVERWRSQADARRHADRVEHDGRVEQVVYLLIDPPHTVTLQQL